MSASSFTSRTHMKSAKRYLKRSKNCESARLGSTTNFRCYVTPNDHHLVLYQLLERLDEMGVRNLSIFIPDPINFSAAFRVRLSRVWRIADQLNFTSPSWINSTRFVFDYRSGKARRENYIATDDGDVATFVRDGNPILFPDFPEYLDVPGKIELIMWKEGCQSS